MKKAHISPPGQKIGRAARFLLPAARPGEAVSPSCQPSSTSAVARMAATVWSMPMRLLTHRS